jgi:hypothetical protein
MEMPSREKIAMQVRTLQIIVAALAIGCLTFAAIAVVLKSAPEPAEDEDRFPVVTSMALAFGGFALGAQAVLSPLLLKQTRQSLVQQEGTSPDDAMRILSGYQTSTIVVAAFAEGACFFNLVAHMIDGSPYTLAMAGLLVLTILMRFPTVNGVADWLEREMRLVKEEREIHRSPQRKQG